MINVKVFNFRQYQLKYFFNAVKALDWMPENKSKLDN
jgi:hypothetical protein